MKAILLFFLSILPLAVLGQDDGLRNLSVEQKGGIIEVVSTWIEEVFKAEDTGRLMRISDVPFALDRKRVLSSTVDLKDMYLTIFRNKGKREVPEFEIEIKVYRSEIIAGCIPINAAEVLVLIDDEDGNAEGILVAVLLKQNEYKVIGFSD